MTANASILPPPSPEHRRIAAGQFDRANQVIAAGWYDYGIQLLLVCCQLDPANLIYRQRLRQSQKARYQNNLRGRRLAFLTTLPGKARLKAALRTHDYLKALALGEEILVQNPWDTGVQLHMAEAARRLDLLDLAAWILEQARQRDPRDRLVNRTLAGLYEACGHFQQAQELWALVTQADPRDPEARHKVAVLAANADQARQSSAEVGQWGKAVGPSPSTEAPPRQEPPVLQALEEQIAQDPTNAEAYLQLARLHRRAGRLDEAQAVLGRGLGPTGNRFELTTELVELDIEPFRQNLAIVDEKLKAQPADAGLRDIRERLVKEINTRELDLYRRQADRFPRNPAFRFELGVRLLRAGQMDEGVEELEEVPAGSGHYWQARFYLGHCHNYRNNWPLAERCFEEALLHVPPAEEAARKELLFQLAQGAANAGDLAKAIDIGRGLAGVDAEYQAIGQRVREWQVRLQSPDLV